MKELNFFVSNENKKEYNLSLHLGNEALIRIIKNFLSLPLEIYEKEDIEKHDVIRRTAQTILNSYETILNSYEKLS